MEKITECLIIKQLLIHRFFDVQLFHTNTQLLWTVIHHSNNLGLQVSSAYFLGEFKSSKAIIPLLKLLREGETEEARIIAAISLYKLNSGIGMYRLKWYAVNEKNELLKKNFQRIYNTYLAEKNS